MKRVFSNLLIINICIISFCAIGLSQTKIGLRGGLNLANINEDLSGNDSFEIEGSTFYQTVSQSDRSCFNLGGFIEYWFSPKFALQINAMYNQKGFVLNGNVNGTIIDQGNPIDITIEIDETIKLSYLSFPILAKAPFGTWDFKPYVLAGPEFGFLLSATDYATLTSQAVSDGEVIVQLTDEIDDDIKEMLDSFELAIDFGGGFSYTFGSIEVFAEFIYSLGLTTISTERFMEQEELKNRVIMIDVGLIYTLN